MGCRRAARETRLDDVPFAMNAARALCAGLVLLLELVLLFGEVLLECKVLVKLLDGAMAMGGGMAIVGRTNTANNCSCHPNEASFMAMTLAGEVYKQQ